MLSFHMIISTLYGVYMSDLSNAEFPVGWEAF